MTTAWFDSPVGGESSVSMIRSAKSKIIICTKEPMTDEQCQDLYYVIQLMVKKGKPLGDILKEWRDGN